MNEKRTLIVNGKRTLTYEHPVSLSLSSIQHHRPDTFCCASILAHFTDNSGKWNGSKACECVESLEMNEVQYMSYIRASLYFCPWYTFG